MSEIASGWYKDPADPATQRYWDGEVWIGEPLPADATPPDGPPAGPASVPVRAPEGAGSDAAAGSPPTSPAGTSPAPPDSSPGRTGEPPNGWVPPPGWPTPPPSQPGSTPPGWVPPGWPPSGAPPQGPPTDGGPPQNWPPPGWPPQSWPPQSRPPSGVHTPPNGPIQNPPAGWPASAGYPYMVMPAPRPHGMALASLGRRFAARLIDILAVGVLSAILTGYLVYQWWQETSAYWQQTWQIVQAKSKSASVPDVTPTMTSRGTWLLVAIFLLVIVIWLAYEVPNIASSGQTPGKRLMGIRVVGLEATTPIGVRRAIRRWMPLGLPVLVWTCFPLGFLFGGILQLINCFSPVINRPLHLALHDRRAFTVVVQTGTASDPQHPDSGSMADSTVAGSPGPDGSNHTPHGGSR